LNFLCTSQEKIKPWSLPEFVTKLAGILQICDILVKIQVINALSELLNSVGIPNKEVVLDAIYRILQTSEAGSAMSYYQHNDGQKFACAALLLIYDIGSTEKQFFIEMMLGYIEGSQETRYGSAYIMCFTVFNIHSLVTR
jgi:hypothetical protein